ncbi:MAG: DUF362 domain-containing protein [Candidatus Aminicenantes bacterium]|nr:DUF362 domain-containing protein [Candidatus Aminicenantes bacterium]
MPTRREFLKDTALMAAGGIVLGDGAFTAGGRGAGPLKSKVVSVAATDILKDGAYNPEAVHRAFAAGLTEMTGQTTFQNAWSSLVSPEDVVGIKINCIGAPKISSSLASINETIAGLKSTGVKDNNIIVWDRTDREVGRTGLQINKGATGVRAFGSSTVSEAILPWVEGYDRDVYVAFDDGTLKKYRELIQRDFTKEGSHREIFNSVAWLWMLIQQGNEKAKKYGAEMRRLYTDYSDREGIKKIAEEVAGMFDDVTIEDEDKSFFSNIVTKDITKLVNIAVLKHNEDSGVTWATKNIALGVTTNKVRFHIDYCAKAIPEILAKPCLKDKMVLHIGEAAKISVVSVAGAQITYDNRIFFSRDPVAMDKIGLDILEAKRKAHNLEPIRDISTHVAACAAKGLGTDDLARIDLRELKA